MLWTESYNPKGQAYHAQVLQNFFGVSKAASWLILCAAFLLIVPHSINIPWMSAWANGQWRGREISAEQKWESVRMQIQKAKSVVKPTFAARCFALCPCARKGSCSYPLSGVLEMPQQVSLLDHPVTPSNTGWPHAGYKCFGRFLSAVIFGMDSAKYFMVSLVFLANPIFSRASQRQT